MTGLEFPEINPIAIDLGVIKIRWYALAYLAGFIGGWLYAILLAKREPDYRPNRLDIDNILPWLVLGVILGGRAGYVLFYSFDYYLAHPLQIPFIWEGGMSFHGGVLGVVAVVICYARWHKFSVLRLSDIIATVAPIGIFFGRLANFINGELFGRVSTVEWAVIFPYGGGLPRHPSQFYEAILEGLVLFAVLSLMATRKDIRNRPGILTGVFLIGYALSRFFVEFYREPDPHIGLLFEYFTLGQILTVPMLIIGVGFIFYARRNNALESKTDERSA